MTFKALRIWFFYILQWEAAICLHRSVHWRGRRRAAHAWPSKERIWGCRFERSRMCVWREFAATLLHLNTSALRGGLCFLCCKFICIGFLDSALCGTDFCVCSWPAGSCVIWRNLWCRVPLVVRWSCVSVTAALTIEPSRLRCTLLWYVLYFFV